jgi:2'-5' RNA ligase
MFGIPGKINSQHNSSCHLRWANMLQNVREYLMIDYARLEFDAETKGNLFDYCLENRVGLADVDNQSSLSPADFKFHLTVIYSSVTNPSFLEGEQDFKPHLLEAKAFDMFGPDEDVLVLKIKLDDVLTSLNEHYKATYGHIPVFDPFRPHITFRGSNSEDKTRVKKLPVPMFDLRADKLIHKIKAD